MAHYSILKEEGNVVWCVVTPCGWIERVRLAWWMVRHADRVRAVIGVPRTWISVCDDQARHTALADEENGGAA